MPTNKVDVTTLPKLTERGLNNPYWQQIARNITRKITTGAWPHKALLPPHRVIANHLGCGVDTVEQALQHVTNLGLIITEERVGRQVNFKPRAPRPKPTTGDSP